VKLESSKSHAQFLRYLLVGGFNTVFGYGVFALVNWSISGLGRYSYVLAALLGSLITITVAFLGYKWLVFRTRGNYLAEWLRCLGVYSTSVLVSTGGLPIVVTLLQPHLRNRASAPYIGGAIMTGLIVIFSFLGHKNVTFRQKMAGEGEKGRPSLPSA
jgi:putative flippase GtrA